MRIPADFRAATRTAWRAAWVVILAALLTGSTLNDRDPLARIKHYTRASEFDFVGWTLSASGVKLEQGSLGSTGYLAAEDRRMLVREFLRLTRQAGELEARQLDLMADPESTGLGREEQANDREIERTRARLAALQAPVESILQEQEAVILADMGFHPVGVPLPPVSFHFTRLPLSVIVSPRGVIRQDASIQLDPNLTLGQQISLEQGLEAGLDVSALVVPLGGIGTYPTMVQSSPSLDWVAEVVAHEWAHNYLFFRPLGFLYETELDTSPEVRTMNETAASLFGEAVSRALLERYYPDLLPPVSSSPSTADTAPAAFDFRAEMHATRIEVDSLLAQGKIEEAEAYMRARRQVFWDQGYHIRRLNQAYFAFYGAYAEEPGGAAGPDPTGEAVRALWERSASPGDFLRRMGGVRNLGQLEQLLEQETTPIR